jgi:hypothetical protein
MRLLLILVLSFSFAAESQAGFIRSFRQRGECQPIYYSCVPVYRCQPRLYYDCVPCPVPVIPQDKAVITEEEEVSLGSNIPLYGYVDYGIPPTGHDAYFGTYNTPVLNTFLFPPPPNRGGFFGGGLGADSSAVASSPGRSPTSLISPTPPTGTRSSMKVIRSLSF